MNECLNFIVKEENSIFDINETMHSLDSVVLIDKAEPRILKHQRYKFDPIILTQFNYVG